MTKHTKIIRQVSNTYKNDHFDMQAKDTLSRTYSMTLYTLLEF